MLRGESRSCGCLKDEILKTASRTHGHSSPVSPEYRAWNNMRNRCSNPKVNHYQDYGGRGIRVCARWQIFENFLADMGRRPSPLYTLERMDNDGNYEPGNCKWATRYEQQHNKRRAYARPVLELAAALGRIA